MRTRDSEWIAIQAETIGPPSVLSADLTPLEYGIVTENAVDDGTLTFTTDVFGQIGFRQSFAAFDGVVSSLRYMVDSALSVVPANAYLRLVNTTRGTWTVFPTFPTTVGTHRVTLPTVFPLAATDTVYLEVYITTDGSAATFGLAHSNGDYSGGALTDVFGSAVAAGDDLTFAVYGAEVPNLPATGGWLFDNEEQGNVIEARILSELDPLRASLPIDTADLTVENGVPNDDYNFLGATSQSVLTSQALRFGIRLGYEDNLLEMTNHRLAGSMVSQDDLYVTIKAEGLWGRLDNEMFYGGRYDANGISIATLVDEVLEGTAVLCTVDAAIDTLVYIPIPVVTKREALTMLAAYAGAYLVPRSDGSLEMVQSLTFDTDNPLTPFRVYDRPKITDGQAINTVKGALFSYSKAASAETIYSGNILLADTTTQEVTILHDPCAEGSLSLSGGSVSGTPTYNTYSTTFTVVPSSTTVGVTLTGKKVEILERAFSKTYLPVGDTVDLRCPIASDPTLLTAMFDHVAQTLSVPQFEFRMRDDASYEVGDKVYLTLASARAYDVWNYVLTTPALSALVDVPLRGTVLDNDVPVVITRITREFNGATDAEVVARLDIDPPKVD